MLVKENDMKQYYLTARYKIYYSGILFLSLIPLIGFVYIFRYNAFCYSPFLIIGVFGIIRAIVSFTNENITISEKSVIYQTVDVTIESLWSEIKSIKNTFSYLNSFRQECLVIDQSKMKIKRTSILGAIILYTTWRTQTPLIPLSCFSNNWRDSELGQQIKQYAPHLFK